MSKRRMFLLETFYENANERKTWAQNRAARAFQLLRLLDYRQRTGKFEAPWHTFVNHGPYSRRKSWQK
jgi:hypothetical protein